MLDGTDVGELNRETPLLEWGILTSLNTVRLLAHIKEQLGVTVPHRSMTGRNFKNIRTITDMVVALAGPVRAAVGTEET